MSDDLPIDVVAIKPSTESPGRGWEDIEITFRILAAVPIQVAIQVPATTDDADLVRVAREKLHHLMRSLADQTERWAKP